MNIQTMGAQASKRHLQVEQRHSRNDSIRNWFALLPGDLLRVDSFLQSAMVWLAGLLITTLSLLKPLPAMALASNAVATVSVTTVSTLATMSNQAKAMAKDTEGKLEAAYGDATGNTGRQVKGKAKQVQASAMKTGDDLKEAAKSVAKKVDDATR